MPAVYLDIIDVLGKRLYAGKVSWLREYVQNSIDAESKNITIELKDSDLIIEDDGWGISESSLRDDAFSPGGSSKNPSEIGELGVGIFAGTGICQKVKILTKEANKKTFEAVFDVDKYRSIIDSDRKALFDEHINSIYSIQEVNDVYPGEDHFTKLMIMDLDDTALSALKGDLQSSWQQTDIQSYLERTLELPIDRKFPFKDELSEFLEDGTSPIEIIVKMNGEVTNLRKLMFINTEFIDHLYTRTFKNGNDEVIAKAWAVYAQSGSAFTESRVLIKHKGMTIGDDGTLVNATHNRLEKRFLGEVISYSDGLEVTTERDWFVESPQLDEFLKILEDVRSDLYYIANMDSQKLQGQIKRKKEIEALRKDLKEINPSSQVAKDKKERITNLQQEMEDLQKHVESSLENKKQGDKGPSEEARNLLRAVSKTRKESMEDPKKETNTEESGEKPETSRTPKKSPVPGTVHNFLTQKVVDKELGKKIKDKDDVKDLTNNAFTYIEVLLKAKVGMSENQHINFEPLVDKFLNEYEPTKVSQDEIRRFTRAFKQFLLSTHYFWRNSSAHTFMDDMKEDRYLFQAIMIADSAVKLIGDFKKKS